MFSAFLEDCRVYFSDGGKGYLSYLMYKTLVRNNGRIHNHCKFELIANTFFLAQGKKFVYYSLLRYLQF